LIIITEIFSGYQSRHRHRPCWVRVSETLDFYPAMMRLIVSLIRGPWKL